MKKSLAASLLTLALLAASEQRAAAGWFDFTWGNYSWGWEGVNCCNCGWWCCNACAVVPGPCHVPPQNFYPFYNCNCPRDVTAVYGGWCPPPAPPADHQPAPQQTSRQSSPNYAPVTYSYAPYANYGYGYYQPTGYGYYQPVSYWPGR
jgi:hypothetical protein